MDYLGFKKIRLSGIRELILPEFPSSFKRSEEAPSNAESHTELDRPGYHHED